MPKRRPKIDVQNAETRGGRCPHKPLNRLARDFAPLSQGAEADRIGASRQLLKLIGPRDIIPSSIWQQTRNSLRPLHRVRRAPVQWDDQPPRRNSCPHRVGGALRWLSNPGHRRRRRRPYTRRFDCGRSSATLHAKLAGAPPKRGPSGNKSHTISPIPMTAGRGIMERFPLSMHPV